MQNRILTIMASVRYLYRMALIGCCVLPVASCLRQSPEDFVAEERKLLHGLWELDSAQVFRTAPEGTQLMDANIIDLADANLNLMDNGTYQASSATFVMYFASQGNEFSSTYDENVGLGAWQYYEKPTRRIHFDRGFAEFFNLAPLIYQIDRLEYDALQISITDKKAIFDFGRAYGRALYFIILNSRVSNDSAGGSAFGALLAQYDGLVDGLANNPGLYRPYTQGLATGMVQMHESSGFPDFISQNFKDAFAGEMQNGPGYQAGINAAANYPNLYGNDEFRLRYTFSLFKTD